MQPLAPREATIWNRRSPHPDPISTDQAINDKYDVGEKRIITESNREKLPNFVAALDRPNYIDLRPFYQRRERWDPDRQSRLIESFIINIPVPPLFLYEKSYNSYEVMDGQQRITAIQAFYTNQLKLTGLTEWPELNGKTYATLPTKIRAGIDRRSIAYIVLLKESTATEEEALVVKQMVFERLNTGGVKLARQEIRNAMYQGPVNSLLLALSRNPILTRAWSIPDFTEEERHRIPQTLMKNRLYRQMEDAELVLRFFALRHVDHFRDGMQGFLDLYMIRTREFGEDDVAFLRELFETTIALAADLYGANLFCAFDAEGGKWFSRPQKAFFDAVMVGLSTHLELASVLKARREQVLARTQRLFGDHPSGTFTGRGNSKADIAERIGLFGEMISSIASA